MSSLFSTSGKVALCTGCTSGIGLGMASGIVEQGLSQVILLHRPSTSPDEAVAKLKSFNKDLIVSFIAVEIATLPVEEIESQILLPALNLSVTQRIDILINNAGIGHRRKAEEFPEDDFNRVLQVDLLFPSKLARLVGRHMLENNIRGKIIFTLSLMSFQGGLYSSPYTISKAGLKGLVQALSNEWASRGISVNGIAPGYIETKLTKVLQDDPIRGRQISERIPIGRWGLPDDFRGPTAFLASEASAYVSGEVLVVDGGWMGR